MTNLFTLKKWTLIRFMWTHCLCQRLINWNIYPSRMKSLRLLTHTISFTSIKVSSLYCPFFSLIPLTTIVPYLSIKRHPLILNMVTRPTRLPIDNRSFYKPCTKNTSSIFFISLIENLHNLFLEHNRSFHMEIQCFGILPWL
jgi:hypothetical protein